MRCDARSSCRDEADGRYPWYIYIYVVYVREVERLRGEVDRGT